MVGGTGVLANPRPLPRPIGYWDLPGLFELDGATSLEMNVLGAQGE
jgi:hypothetical protein